VKLADELEFVSPAGGLPEYLALGVRRLMPLFVARLSITVHDRYWFNDNNLQFDIAEC
jgi:hypothetical protein